MASSSPLQMTGMPPQAYTIAWVRKNRPIAPSTSSGWPAADRPVSAAVVPLIRRSPVAGFSWNTRPRAVDPGYRPEYQSERNRRWWYPLRPTPVVSSSVMAHPMSSWHRT